ncbi:MULTISPECIES: hypothetical protein [unclassified Cohnella]|uniref:hypothetical protein n=1 Tax=unclassified Cohnella TaxID=2636738 RepID=UPI0011806122|nr:MULTISPECIES: hypothetical protein [unclassified Cohnella]
MPHNIINKLIGKRIQQTRLAGNSLILYIESTHSIWLEPTWHMHDDQRVLIGSRQLQVDSKEEMDQLGEPLQELISKQIGRIDINKITNDISIQIDKFFIHTFVVDPFDDFMWQINDLESNKLIEASSKEIKLRESPKK